MMTRTFFALLLFIFAAADQTFAVSADSAKLEFSFGTSQMFISETNRKELAAEEKVILPTQSALFLGEYFINRRFAVLVVYNLPFSTQKMFINNKLVEEKASPYIGAGVRWAPVSVMLWNRIRVEPHAAATAGPMVREDWSVRFVPVAAGRMHLSSRDGFTMYFGGFYTVGVNAPSLIYGVGHRF